MSWVGFDWLGETNQGGTRFSATSFFGLGDSLFRALPSLAPVIVFKIVASSTETAFAFATLAHSTSFSISGVLWTQTSTDHPLHLG